jgi:hypothetical protein
MTIVHQGKVSLEARPVDVIYDSTRKRSCLPKDSLLKIVSQRLMTPRYAILEWVGTMSEKLVNGGGTGNRMVGQ